MAVIFLFCVIVLMPVTFIFSAIQEVELIRYQVKQLVSLSKWVLLQQVNILYRNQYVFKLL